MLNTFEETFEDTEMRTFKHEAFFIVGGGGGGAYSWYFRVAGVSDQNDFPTPAEVNNEQLSKCM